MQPISLPPLVELQRIFHLDLHTGVLTRFNSVRGVGNEAGWLGKNGYRYVSIQYRKYLVHRIVHFMATGEDPGERLVDHRDADTVDNRPTRLRNATHIQNCQNQHNLRSDNTSGIRGVYWNKAHGKWYARLTVNKKPIFLGLYSDIAVAEKVVRDARRVHFKQFAGG